MPNRLLKARTRLLPFSWTAAVTVVLVIGRQVAVDMRDWGRERWPRLVWVGAATVAVAVC